MGLSGGLIWSYLGDGMGTCGNDCVTGGKGGKRADTGFQQWVWYLAVWGELFRPVSNVSTFFDI